MYGGQELNVGNGVKGAFKSKLGSAAANEVNIAAGGVKFGEAETAAATRLGFQAEDVAIKSGVAEIPIIYTSTLKGADIKTVLGALKSIGAKSLR